MNSHFFVWCLLIIPFNLCGSRIIGSVAENEKYKYRTDLFRLLHDDAGEEEVPLRYLLYKACKPAYRIPKKYKKIIKKYGLYTNGAYTIDCAIVRSVLTEYVLNDSDDISDDEAEEMPSD